MDSESINENIQAAADAAVGLLSTWGLSVVGAIVLLIVGRIVAGWIRSSVSKGLTRAGTDSTLVPFFSSMAYYLALAVVVIAVLSLFGIETTSLIAVLGAAGLAVGLALQGTLSNFSAGVMLLIFRPIRVGTTSRSPARGARSPRSPSSARSSTRPTTCASRFRTRRSSGIP